MPAKASLAGQLGRPDSANLPVLVRDKLSTAFSTYDKIETACKDVIANPGRQTLPDNCKSIKDSWHYMFC